MATPILNVTEFTVASNGQILETSGTSIFHAQSNYANLILLNLEDGIGLNSTTFMNFTLKETTSQTVYTSHWFYSDFQGFVTKVIGGVTRHFAQFAIRVPNTVLQNNRPNRVTNNILTFIQRYGENLLGVFNYLSNLNETHPIVEIDSAGTYGSVDALQVAVPANISTLGNFAVIDAFPETGIYHVVGSGTSYYINEWISATEEDYNNASGAIIQLGDIGGSILSIAEATNPSSTLIQGTIARAYSISLEKYVYAKVSTEEVVTTDYQWVLYDGLENTIYVETLYGVQYTIEGGVYTAHTNLITYVISDETEAGVESGFYIIQRNQYCSNDIYTSQATCESNSGTWTDAYEWTLNEGSLSGYLFQKQYNVGEIMVQAGQSNPLDLPSISVSQTQVILQILSNLQQRIDNLTFNIEERFVATDLDENYNQTGVVGNPIENSSQLFVRTGLENEYIEYEDLKENINTEQNDRLDDLEQKDEDLQTVLSGLESADSALDGRLDVVEPKISTLESEVQALEDKTEAISRSGGETTIDDEEVRVGSSVGEISVYAKSNLYLESDTANVELIGATKVELNAPIVELVGGSTTPSTPNSVLNKQALDNHNTSETAHLFIRTLIENLEQEIQRLDGSGKSFGEIPYTTEYIKAQDEQGLAYLFYDYFLENYNDDLPFQNGYLVYDLGTGDGVAYHEWEFNGTDWVDNGLIGYTQASNTVHGMVKGDETYVSIVSGIIQVLLSDYAERLGTSEGYYDYTSLASAISNLIDKNFSSYDDVVIDDTDLMLFNEGGVSKKGTVGDLKSHIAATTGTFDATADYQPQGLGAYESAVLDVHDVTLHADGDFRCTIKAIETDKLLYVQFPTVTATENLRLSTDNGSTYYNVLKNGSTVEANVMSGQLVEMYFNGTNFIAYVKDDIYIVEQDVLDLETANMIKSITRSGSDLFTITYYDDTTSSLLTLTEIKTFIGEATQSLSGLMSAQDKTDLDTLMALFDEDGDEIVNTIAEILAIFEDYPEGADLVTALAGKVDKTSIVDNLTTDDATKVLSAKQGKVLNDAVALKANTSDIVNNLTSTDTNKPLSANQGKVLNDLIGNIDAILDSILGV